MHETPLKADLTVHEAKRSVGHLLGRAISIAGLSIKEAARLIGAARGSDLDPAQLSRWIAGSERLHFEAVYAVPEIAQPFLTVGAQGLGADVETHVRWRTA